MAYVFWNRVHNKHARSSKVVDFGPNLKRVLDFLLVLNSNLGFILPKFRDIKAFVRRKPLFSTPQTYFGQTNWNTEIIFEVFRPMQSRYLNATEMDRLTDRETDG